jgi:hypothetical protein
MEFLLPTVIEDIKNGRVKIITNTRVITRKSGNTFKQKSHIAINEDGTHFVLNKKNYDEYMKYMPKKK